MVDAIDANSVDWSHEEQLIARKAFILAQQREIDTILETLRDRINAATTVEQVWELHDYLSTRRYEIEGKYDYRYSNLIFVFASLVKDRLLHIEELSGLEFDKLSKVKAMSKM